MKKTKHFYFCGAPICAEMEENPKDVVALPEEPKCILLRGRTKQKIAK